MAPAAKGVATLGERRTNTPDYPIERPADGRHLGSVVGKQLILHRQIIIQASAVAYGVIADFKATAIQLDHLSPGQVPVLAGLERIEIADIERAPKAEWLEDRRDNCRMTGGCVVKSQNHQPVRDGLPKNAVWVRIDRSLPDGKGGQKDSGEEEKLRDGHVDRFKGLAGSFPTAHRKISDW